MRCLCNDPISAIWTDGWCAAMSHRSVAQFALGHRPAPAASAEFGRVLALRTGHRLPRRRLHSTAIFGRHAVNVLGQNTHDTYRLLLLERTMHVCTHLSIYRSAPLINAVHVARTLTSASMHQPAHHSVYSSHTHTGRSTRRSA